MRALSKVFPFFRQQLFTRASGVPVLEALLPLMTRAFNYKTGIKKTFPWALETKTIRLIFFFCLNRSVDYF